MTLDLPGWKVGNVSDSYGVREMQFTHDSQELEVDQYAASQYDGYYADRNVLDDRQPIQVLGQPGTMWTYAADDHTVIRSVQGSHFVEIRGTGMSKAEFRGLLDSLALTDEAGFAQAMPDQAVTPENRDRAIARLLRGVDVPPGFTAADVRLAGFNDAYQASARVAGSVGCAWIDVFDGGSASQRQAAVDAFAASRHWPLLVDIADQGDYSSGLLVDGRPAPDRDRVRVPRSSSRVSADAPARQRRPTCSGRWATGGAAADGTGDSLAWGPWSRQARPTEGRPTDGGARPTVDDRQATECAAHDGAG